MLFSLLDTKTGIFGPLMDCETAASAVRNIKTFLNSGEKSMFSMYPEDYELFQLGDYDKTVGTVIGLEAPLRICSLLEVKAQLLNKENSDVSVSV